MAQIFPPSADTWLRSLVLVLALAVVGGIFAWGALAYSGYSTSEAVAVEQPVPFSHKHHVGDDGIDCRYCHTGVETGAMAGLPPTKTCMTCHSQIFTEADILAPVRESWQAGRPIRWKRVYDLPDFVYFDHSIHVAKGVGCTVCHGDIDAQPLTRQAAPMQMHWCLDCHRDPAPHLRPPERVFDVDWQPPADRRALGVALIERHDVRVGEITHCYTCHR